MMSLLQEASRKFEDSIRKEEKGNVRWIEKIGDVQYKSKVDFHF